MPALDITLHPLADDDASTASVWVPPRPVRVAASGPLGGGIGQRSWVVNVTVGSGYDRDDPDRHLEELAAALGLRGRGVGMLTAVDVTEACAASDGGVEVVITVGLTWPTWAAAPEGDPNPYDQRPVGTINTIAWVPVALRDAALVGAVITATEAKTQALVAAGIPGTGTATDAVCIACPVRSGHHERDLEPFAGPRSTWGARLARAVAAAVTNGARDRRRA